MATDLLTLAVQSVRIRRRVTPFFLHWRINNDMTETVFSNTDDEPTWALPWAGLP